MGVHHRKLAQQVGQQGRSPELFIQVNTGDEPQKAGIDPTLLVAANTTGGVVGSQLNADQLCNTRAAAAGLSGTV